MGNAKDTCKQIAKVVLGKRFYNRFAQTVFCRKNPDFRKYALRNADLKGKYAGKRCFIIGNGPSLKSVDFDLLANEYTFTVNQLPRNENFAKLKTNFHVWADARFFQLDLDKEEDRELLGVMDAVCTENNRPLVFYKWPARDLIETTQLGQNLDIRYFGDIGMDIPKKLRSGRLVDICKPLPVFSTVIHYAVCMAVYMGFHEIYLLGCDCTGFITTAQTKLKNNNQAEYAYTLSQNEQRRMQSVSTQTSIRDELVWYADLFDTYDLLKTYCDRQGVRLLNATQSTLLETIPKVSIADLF